MCLDERLVETAITQAERRFPNGGGGAAELYLLDGRILTSVAFDSPNEKVNLCHETGATCEADRLNLPVTASVCVERASETDPFFTLTPCGVCQEQLALWGPTLKSPFQYPAIPTNGKPENCGTSSRTFGEMRWVLKLDYSIPFATLSANDQVEILVQRKKVLDLDSSVL